MMKYDQSVLSESTFIRDRTQELVFRSQALCAETQTLIDASKDVIGDLDTFLSEFDPNSAANDPG